VSKAISDTLNRIRPEKPIKIHAVQANGVQECKRLLQEALSGEIKANFYEGMGCVGGCVGGPKAVIAKELGKEIVDNYGSEAKSLTPADNAYVLELLARLGIKEVDDLLHGESAAIFQRNFD
jgi:iron only hydrogenase large subunit-like protein